MKDHPVIPLRPRLFITAMLFLGMLFVQGLPLLPAQIQGMLIQICTLQGAQTILVAEDGQGDPVPGEGPSSSIPCPFCILRSLTLLTPPDHMAAVGMRYVREVVYRLPPMMIVNSASQQRFRARGPPSV